MGGSSAGKGNERPAKYQEKKLTQSSAKVAETHFVENQNLPKTGKAARKRVAKMATSEGEQESTKLNKKRKLDIPCLGSTADEKSAEQEDPPDQNDQSITMLSYLRMVMW